MKISMYPLLYDSSIHSLPYKNNNNSHIIQHSNSPDFQSKCNLLPHALFMHQRRYRFETPTILFLNRKHSNGDDYVPSHAHLRISLCTRYIKHEISHSASPWPPTLHVTIHVGKTAPLHKCSRMHSVSIRCSSKARGRCVSVM